MNPYKLICILAFFFFFFFFFFSYSKASSVSESKDVTNILIRSWMNWWVLTQKAPLIVLGFNDTSTLVGHFVLSPREREKRDRRDSRGDERDGQGRKRNRNESEETEEIKTVPLYSYLLQGLLALPNCKPISVGGPGDVTYTTPSPHLRTHPSNHSSPLTQKSEFVADDILKKILKQFISAKLCLSISLEASAWQLGFQQ